MTVKASRVKGLMDFEVCIADHDQLSGASDSTALCALVIGSHAPVWGAVNDPFATSFAIKLHIHALANGPVVLRPVIRNEAGDVRAEMAAITVAVASAPLTLSADLAFAQALADGLLDPDDLFIAIESTGGESAAVTISAFVERSLPTKK